MPFSLPRKGHFSGLSVFSALYGSRPGDDAAQILHMGIAHMLQDTDRLPAPNAAAAVDIQRGILVLHHRWHLFHGLQGDIDRPGDVSLPELLRRADIQQNRTGNGPIFLYACVDIMLLEKIEKYLCYFKNANIKKIRMMHMVNNLFGAKFLYKCLKFYRKIKKQ